MSLWKNYALGLGICFALCLFTSCQRLCVMEDDYNGKSPSYSAYRENKESGLIDMRRFFWVRNYRGVKKNRNKLDQIALGLICESLEDTVNIARLSLEFAAGGSQWDIEPIADYMWVQDKPNEVEVLHSSSNNLDELIQVVLRLDCMKSGGVKKKPIVVVCDQDTLRSPSKASSTKGKHQMSVLHLGLRPRRSRLRVMEDNYNHKSPRYSAHRGNKESGLIDMSRFFLVENYKNVKKSGNKLDQIALELICESLGDTVNIVALSLEFATRGSKGDIKPIAGFGWYYEKPNEVINTCLDWHDAYPYKILQLDCTKSGEVKK